VKYKRRKLDLQVAKAVQHDDSDHDSEFDLFKARGISGVESEDVKWMKQQPVKRDTDVYKY
jgi:hypothetical protein